jgi:hypothetical protein
MTLFEQFTIRRDPTQLRIYRQPGLFFWLFAVLYTGFTIGLNLLFLAMFLEMEAPQTLTCRSRQQQVDCDYVTSGPLSGKTVRVQDLRSAIVSQKPNGEAIVLTSSQPWVLLQATDNNAQTIQQINQALEQLRQRDQVWQLQMQPPAGAGLTVLLFFGPIGLLFLLASLLLLLSHGSACFEFDPERNRITLIKLGVWRSRPAQFTQLLQAERKPCGYLGALSDRFGIYAGDSLEDRYGGREIVRLIFANRPPLTLTQTSHRHQAANLVGSINQLIAEQP